MCTHVSTNSTNIKPCNEKQGSSFLFSHAFSLIFLLDPTSQAMTCLYKPKWKRFMYWDVLGVGVP